MKKQEQRQVIQDPNLLEFDSIQRDLTIRVFESDKQKRELFSKIITASTTDKEVDEIRKREYALRAIQCKLDLKGVTCAELITQFLRPSSITVRLQAQWRPLGDEGIKKLAAKSKTDKEVVYLRNIIDSKPTRSSDPETKYRNAFNKLTKEQKFAQLVAQGVPKDIAQEIANK